MCARHSWPSSISSFRFLDAQRFQLKAVEQQLDAQLTGELAAHSPNAGATDASHQAVLRELSDNQQWILRLEEQRPYGAQPRLFGRDAITVDRRGLVQSSTCE